MTPRPTVGRQEEALRQLERGEQLDPLLQTLVNAGRLAEARVAAQRILRYVGTDIAVKGQVAYALGRAGDVTRAQPVIADIARDTADVRTDVALLRAHLGTGDTAQALDAMERLVASRRPFAVSMDFQTPHFDLVRTSPRYVAALRALGLDPARLAPVRSRN